VNNVNKSYWGGGTLEYVEKEIIIRRFTKGEKLESESNLPYKKAN